MRITIVSAGNLQSFMKLIASLVSFHQESVVARCHTTQGVRQWLAEQFGVVISGPLLAEWPWPANSPDLPGCDYWLWGHILQEIRRVKPESLEELRDIVDTFVDSLDPEEVRKATADIYPRARLCIDNGEGHFEAELKKYKRRSDVEE